MVTSNHVHLLVWTPRLRDVSTMMHWLQGTTAQDYNRRKRREGSFWRGRFHATLVQTGEHLSRCLFYLDMNMVRAGVVQLPWEWRFGGSEELLGKRRRYRIVDAGRLLACLGVPDTPRFRKWYEATLRGQCRQTEFEREPFWGSAFAVGEPAWLVELAGGLEDVVEHTRPADPGAADSTDTHVLRVPQSLYLRLWERLTLRNR